MLSVLTRNGDFRRLYFAQLIVFGADWFVMVPLLVLLTRHPGMGLWAGLALAVDTGVVALLLPYAGTVADRFDRRKILITSNVAAITAIGGLFAVQGKAAGPIALVAIAALATAKAFYSPAASSAIPNVVDRDDLASAMAVSGTTWGTMTIIGSSLGGLLSSWLSPYFCFALVGVGLVGAVALTLRVRRPMQETVSTGERPAFAAIRESIHYLRGEPRLLTLVTVKSAVGLGNGVLTAFPIVATQFGVGPRGLGLMFATRGLGALIGPLLFRRVLNRPSWLLPGLALSMSAYGLSYIGVSMATWFPLVLLGIFFAHIAGGGNWVMSGYAIQQLVPDDLRGRVNAGDTMLAMLAITVSQLIVSLFIDSISPSVLIACCGATTLSYAIGWRLITRRFAETKPALAVLSGAQ